MAVDPFQPSLVKVMRCNVYSVASLKSDGVDLLGPCHVLLLTRHHTGVVRGRVFDGGSGTG